MDLQESNNLTQLRGALETLGESIVLGTVEQRQLEEVRNGLKLLRLSGEFDPSTCTASAKLEQSFSEGFRGDGGGDLSQSIIEFQNALVRLAPRRSTSENEQESRAAAFAELAQDPELLQDFIGEAREHLSTIENGLLKIEENPCSSEPIHAVFRSFHTIKGLAGFLELGPIQELAHEVETVLDMARNSQIQMGSAVIDIILASADHLSHSINAVEQGLNGQPVVFRSNASLLERVRTLIGVETKHAEDSDSEPAGIKKLQASDSCPDTGGIDSTQVPGTADPSRVDSDPSPNAGGVPNSRIPPSGAEGGNVQAAVTSNGASANMVIRIETAKLDHLLDMVGELVIAQSMVRHDPTLGNSENVRLQAHLAHLNRITDEVQKTTMTLRMVPIGNLFQRMKRLVRDVARKAGKQAELEIVGEETELDKTVVDGLADPLMHMVRNALDHGIEPTPERQAAGKPPVGKVSLRAYHQGGHMLIEIADDGRGLDKEKILAKAKQKGIITPGSLLSDSEVFQLIFEPGFSTAEKITDISGRGVGMDVVKRNIEKMRGRVDIHSVRGSGSKFLIRLPLTLAIIDGLVVGVGAERYIIPIFAVTEMFRPTASMISTIKNKHEMVTVRGRLLPVVRLYEKFGVAPKNHDPCQSLFIVSDFDGVRFCLMVDEFIGKQEVVIKSLGQCFKNIPGIAGGAILGDGRVGLIVEMAGVLGDNREVVA